MKFWIFFHLTIIVYSSLYKAMAYLYAIFLWLKTATAYIYAIGSETVNLQNYRMWSTNNLYVFEETSLYPI